MLSPEDTGTVFRRLSERYPGKNAETKGPKGQPDAFRSLVGCLLSAQSLDRNTAAAATALFALARTPDEILALDDETLIGAIRPAGLYNVKARNLRRLARTLIDEHAGLVPETRAGLMALPGIGRKCADIVMSFTFDADVIAVDTHVHRVCNRLTLATGRTEAATAASLDARAPAWAKRDGHIWLLHFGKQVCKARKPACQGCPLADLCPSSQAA